MSDNYRKKIEKISDIVNDKHDKKVQVGYTPENPVRKVGDRWTDSEGIEYVQREGYIAKGKAASSNDVHYTWKRKCSDCKSLILKKWDEDSYKFNGRCYYCQIDYEAKLRGPTKFNQNTSDDLHKYRVERFENFIEGYKKEYEAWKKEQDAEREQLLKNGLDKSVANALANSNVDTTMKINKNKLK